MSEVKVNKLSPRSGTTVTIGDSGDTINVVGTLQNNGSVIPGDISSVVAGTGLSGGGTSGDVTLNVEAAQSGITSLGTITTFRSTGIDDNADALAITIDSNESVGINNTNMASFDADARNLVVGSGSGDNGLTVFSDGSSSGSIFFSNGTSGTQTKQGQIVYEQNNSAMIFSTGASERVRIDSSGNLFVATTTVASDDVGHALLANGSAYHTADGTYAGLFNRKSSNGEIVQIRKDNTVVGKIGIETGGLTVDGEANHSGIMFSASSFLPRKNYSSDNGTVDLGTTDGRWKDLYLDGGAFLGGTGTANKLDDYEKGTYTAGVFDANSGGNQSATTATGYYTKIGRLVNFNVAFANINTTGLTGSNRIFVSLPFASINGQIDAQTSPFVKNVTFNDYLIFGESSGSQKSRFGFISIDSGSNSSSTTVSNFTDDDNYCSISLTYITDD